MNKNALPRSSALLIVIALLALMSARSPISSFAPAEAYAPENDVSQKVYILQANIGSGMQGENRNRLGGGITTTNGIDQKSF